MYSGDVLSALRVGKIFRGGGSLPLMSLFGMAYLWGGKGILMNFGFSGPMEARGVVVLNDRIGSEIVERRERELNELLDIEGGIAVS